MSGRQAMRLLGTWLLFLALSGLACAEMGTGELTFSLQTPLRTENTPFSFELRLSSDAIHGPHGDLTFHEGRAAFSLRRGDLLRATNLPAGLSYRLVALDEEDYVPRYYDAGGHGLSAPRGRVPSGSAGLVIAEVYTGALEATLQLDLTGLVPSDARLIGLSDSDAKGRSLSLRREEGKVVTESLRLRGTRHRAYQDAGLRHYAYEVPTLSGETLTLTIDATLEPGASVAAYDDALSLHVAMMRGDEPLALDSWQGKGGASLSLAEAAGALASRAELALTGEVMLLGRRMAPEEFCFAVLEDGERVASATNAADGSLRFTPIAYGAGDEGEHVYAVRQIPGTLGDLFYDDREYALGVQVSRDDGQMRAALGGITLDGRSVPTLHFENKYALTDFKVYNLWQGGNEGEIELILYADGEKLRSQPEVRREGATYLFADLPMFDASGRKIVYSARERYVDQYLAMYVNTGEYAERTRMLYHGGTVINRKVFDFPFRVVYHGLSGQEAPPVHFTLYDGDALLYDEKQPERDGYGRLVYRHLPVKRSGRKADYLVRACPMEGYLLSYENRGEYAAQRDGLRAEGTVHVRRVPRTGERPNPWGGGLVLCLLGLILCAGIALWDHGAMGGIKKAPVKGLDALADADQQIDRGVVDEHRADHAGGHRDRAEGMQKNVEAKDDRDDREQRRQRPTPVAQLPPCIGAREIHRAADHDQKARGGGEDARERAVAGEDQKAGQEAGDGHDQADREAVAHQILAQHKAEDADGHQRAAQELCRAADHQPGTAQEHQAQQDHQKRRQDAVAKGRAIHKQNLRFSNHSSAASAARCP